MLPFFKKTFKGLKKTRQKIANVFLKFSGKKYLEPGDLETLEEALLQADLGWKVVEHVIEKLEEPGDSGKSWGEKFICALTEMLPDESIDKNLKRIIIIVGVNGTGKTTSAAKLAGYYAQKKEQVSLIAADTYRAAAVEQLKTWSERLGVHLVANTGTSDPAAVAFDGVNSGMSRNQDRMLVDTAGRLHTSVNLMKELEKIYRVVTKLSSEISVLITIDANTGQNGITQAREFHQYLPVDGVILTKMDGTARGGIAVPIMLELGLPVYYIGVGEQVDDLIPFSMDTYLRGLIGMEEEAEV